MQIDLTISYPRGTLIVDDPVKISGIAFLNNLRAQDMIFLNIGFENAQFYPVDQDNRGITKGASIIFQPTQEDNKLKGDMTVSWALEGNYHPQIAYGIKNAAVSGIPQSVPVRNFSPSSNPTNMMLAASGTSPSVAITVYPKSQVAQIITNKAFLYLAIATYIVGAFSVFSIIVQLWKGTI